MQHTLCFKRLIKLCYEILFFNLGNLLANECAQNARGKSYIKKSVVQSYPAFLHYFVAKYVKFATNVNLKNFNITPKKSFRFLRAVVKAIRRRKEEKA
jgi:hypothetical protein